MGSSSSVPEEPLVLYPPPHWAWEVEPKNLITAETIQFNHNPYLAPCANCQNGLDQPCIKPNKSDAECLGTPIKFEKCYKKRAEPIIDATGRPYLPTGGNDYSTTVQKCGCYNQPVCSALNITECFLGKDPITQFDPTYRVDWSGEREIMCTYDLDKFTTYEQIFNFKNKFNPDPDNDNWFNLMSDFCSKTTNKCLTDPTTGKRITECSYVTATSGTSEVKFCQAWFASLPDDKKDLFIEFVCSKNPSRAECKCEMRANDPVYNKLSKYFTDAVEDACVYIPCKRATPAFLVNSKDSKPSCPSVLCQNVYNIDAVGNATISENQSYLACTAPQKKGDGSDDHISVPTKQGNKPPHNTVWDWPDFHKPKVQRIIGIVLLIVILIIFAVLMVVLVKQ